MPQKEGPPTVTIRMDAELVQKARTVCANRTGRNKNQLKLVDYLDSLVRGLIERDYQETIERLARELPQEGRQGRRSKEG